MLRVRTILIGLLVFVTLGIHAQGYNSNRIALTNFLVRMYNDAPFDGVLGKCGAFRFRNAASA